MTTAPASGLPAQSHAPIPESTEPATTFHTRFRAFRRAAHRASLPKGARGHGYNYLRLDTALEALVPLMEAQGLWHYWSATPWEAPGGQPGVQVSCIITDGSECHSSTMGAPADTTGSKGLVQGLGSSVSYCCRYTLLSLCGVVAGQEDTDGAVTASAPARQAQPTARPPRAVKRTAPRRPANGQTISASDAATIRAAANALSPAGQDGFRAWLKPFGRVDLIPADRLVAAQSILTQMEALPNG